MQTVSTFDQFLPSLESDVALVAKGEVFPFAVPPPDLAAVVDQARQHDKVRIASGRRSRVLHDCLEEPEADFRALPLEQAVEAPIHMSIFDLGSMRQPGGALHDIIEQVYLPLVGHWRQAGLGWKRVYPILFLSGPGCSTNYHWDPSSVLIVQLHGRKRFHSLKEPQRWCGEAVLAQAHDGMVRPEALTPDDILTCELTPGDAVWSPCRAPHWVDAYDETAFTLSIGFTDITPTRAGDAEMTVD
ncbi:MAG: hypothetical protein GKR89_16000 [Candidatus Latescibacteria bacterium]|nr:hypothetical protein [Candidatus Latescibacterota bacterium]